MTVPLKHSISNEEIYALPTLKCEDDIIVVDHIDEVELYCNELATYTAIGFDTETKPNFVKGSNHTVSLLQLSSPTKNYIFRIKKIGLPLPLINLLSNDNILKIGVAVRDDVKELVRVNSFEPKGFLDLQNIVHQYGIEDKGLKKLAAIVLGGRISKSQRTSNWENEELSEAQLSYAATDSWVCLKIWEKLQSIKKEI